MSKAEASRRLCVNPSTVTRWCQRGTLKTHRGQVRVADVEQIAAEAERYVAEHASTVAALEALSGRLGQVSGDATRRAVEAARELVLAADDWNARANAGGSPETTRELSDTVRGRIALIAVIHDYLATVEGMQALSLELLPLTPRRELLARALRAGMDPELAAAVIGAMDEDMVQEKLTGLAELNAGADWSHLQGGDHTKTPAQHGEEL